MLILDFTIGVCSFNRLQPLGMQPTAIVVAFHDYSRDPVQIVKSNIHISSTVSMRKLLDVACQPFNARPDEQCLRVSATHERVDENIIAGLNGESDLSLVPIATVLGAKLPKLLRTSKGQALKDHLVKIVKYSKVLIILYRSRTFLRHLSKLAGSCAFRNWHLRAYLISYTAFFYALEI